TAKEHLYWNLLGPWRWKDSRWSGQSPKDEREQEFRYAMGTMRKIINDPKCNSLLRKHVPYVPVSVARKYLTTWIERVPSHPHPQKKGVLRKQTNVLRNLYIADTLALVQRKHGLNVTRACKCVADALFDLKLPPWSKKSVETIWGKHRHRYPDLLRR